MSDSIISDSRSASAEALTSIFIPFAADASEVASVFFLYDLFVSADALLSGEFSLAIATLNVSLLDDGFNEIEFGLSDELLATAQAGTDFPNAIFGSFDYTFTGLTEGDSYFVAIDAYAFSATEANPVPEPGTVMLFMMVLSIIGGFRLCHTRFKQTPYTL